VIYLNGFKSKPLSQAVLKIIKKIYKLEKLRSKTVSVSLVSSSQIQKLNRNFRSKDKVTDVLSFPQDHYREHGILGDVVICLSKAKSQAKEYGHTLERELCFLTTHGIYHLLGYDHHTIQETKRMRRKEKLIMGDR
jgi:probable rRNA maturation factor